MKWGIKMSKYIAKIKVHKYFFLFLFLLLIILISPFSTFAADSKDSEDNINEEIIEEKKEMKNPFYDYRKNDNENDNKNNTSESQNQDIIKIKDKKEPPTFYWQGLILVEDQYNILLSLNNETHIMKKGDKLNGYKIVDIDSNKITLSKKNYIYYLKMGSE